MQPQDPTIAGTRRPAKSSAWRYGLSLVLLVVVVGGIAWLVQYLPDKRRTQVAPPPPAAKKLLDFPIDKAIWAPASASQAADKSKPAPYQSQYCEVGESGSYDFLFRNVAGEDVEITSYTTSCDCTSVKVSPLSAAELDRLLKHQQDKPGEPLPYAHEPAWHKLHAEGISDPDNPPKASLPIQADAGGVVRLRWVAKKSAGQDLVLKPKILVRTVAETGRREEVRPLIAQVSVTLPLQFMPPRASAGVLTPGATGRAEFKAWSSTRDKLAFALTTTPKDPLITTTIRPYAEDERVAFEKQLRDAKIATRVLSAFQVTVFVHESKDGHQLEQGVFYRKLPVTLDGRPTELLGPEIIGSVQGDVRVGGVDDQGKVRFQSFEAKYGASKTVQLSADANATLQEHLVHPAWVKVKLSKKTTTPIDGRHIWELEVTVPPDTRDARSFRDEDAVVLRITDRKNHFVRIPLEGTISGGG